MDAQKLHLDDPAHYRICTQGMFEALYSLGLPLLSVECLSEHDKMTK